MQYIKDPRRVIHATNNKVTVGVPMMTIDVDNILANAKLEKIGNVDSVSEGLVDGSVLVYDASTEKWKSTLLFKLQTADAGNY